MPFDQFRDRQTDFMAYRGAVCNQKGSLDPRRLHAKNQGHRPTNQPIDGHEG